ncbi:MAG: thermonuclease family protein, partial [Candidatus Krumholzibacteriota bacterium]|nr:thermonuclease family protein [Candidatus Krumholzibacteriota bacterium]
VLNGCGNAGRSGEHPASYPGARRVDVSHIRFDDGDSFYLRDEPIRLLGVDTPETKSPGVGIFIDQPWGPEAAESTRVWILSADVVEIVVDGRGKYGRRLAHIFLDGDLLAVRLIDSALAYENVSHFGDNGFPELADRILDAAERSERPPFEEPYRWRRKNQKKQN